MDKKWAGHKLIILKLVGGYVEVHYTVVPILVFAQNFPYKKVKK